MSIIGSPADTAASVLIPVPDIPNYVLKFIILHEYPQNSFYFVYTSVK